MAQPVLSERMTKYRWVVLTLIFIVYTISYGDRANIGVVLPLIKTEFHLSNFEAGSIASLFGTIKGVSVRRWKQRFTFALILLQ